MEDVLDLSDHRVTSEVHVFSEGTLDPDNHEDEKIGMNIYSKLWHLLNHKN